MPRYKLPEGMQYRPFGIADVYTNANITDEKVEALFKVVPAAKKVFIDTQAEKKAETSAEDTRTKKQLAEAYAQLTGQAPDDKLSKAELLELVKAEEEARKQLG